MDKPLQVSVRDYRRLTSLILDFVSPETCTPGTASSPSGSTGRPFSPLNGRSITRHCLAQTSDGATKPAPTSGTTKEKTKKPSRPSAPTRRSRRETSAPICPGEESKCTTEESDQPGVHVFRIRAGRRCQQSCLPPNQASVHLSHPSGSYKCWQVRKPRLNVSRSLLRFEIYRYDSHDASIRSY